MSWTYGIHAVETLLESSPDVVEELWLVKSRKPGKARERLRDRARALGVRFRMVDDGQLRRALGDVVHQGVAARTAEFRYAEPEALLEREGSGLILVLDGVQDPHNLGAIVRTAAGLGVAGVVIPRHRAVGVTPTVRKVATGAEQRVSIARATNLARFLEASADAGYWRYAAVVGEGERLGSRAFAERAVIVMGSESKGVRPNVASKCDARVTLPMASVESLNVSVAAGIFAWEWAREHGRVEEARSAMGSALVAGSSSESGGRLGEE